MNGRLFEVADNGLQLGEPWMCTFFRQIAVMYQYGELTINRIRI
jgi:hypothetical protein